MAVGFKLDPRRGCAKGNGSCPPEEGACVSGSSSCSAVLGLQARRQDRPPPPPKSSAALRTVYRVGRSLGDVSIGVQRLSVLLVGEHLLTLQNHVSQSQPV